MTNTHSLRTLSVSLMFVAAALAMLAVQYAVSFFAKGLSDSSGMRVSANTAACSASDAHFTGCSSIL